MRTTGLLLSSLRRSVALLVLLASQAALAATVGFPADKPEFTFETPEGWSAVENQPGRLTLSPRPDDGFRIAFVATPPSADAAALQRGMGLMVDGVVKATGLADEERGDIETTEVETGRWFVAQRVDGTIQDTPVVLVFQLFNTPAGHGYSMYSVGPPEADEAHTADYEAILESITMVQ